jgi:hypothetical protein
VIYICNPRLRKGDYEFKASLGCIVRSRLAWAIQQDFVSKRKKKKKPHSEVRDNFKK